MPPRIPKASVPDFIPPQHPLLVARATRGEYRVQLRVEKKRAAVHTREGHDWTDRFAGIAGAAMPLPAAM